MSNLDTDFRSVVNKVSDFLNQHISDPEVSNRVLERLGRIGDRAAKRTWSLLPNSATTLKQHLDLLRLFMQRPVRTVEFASLNNELTFNMPQWMTEEAYNEIDVAITNSVHDSMVENLDLEDQLLHFQLEQARYSEVIREFGYMFANEFVEQVMYIACLDLPVSFQVYVPFRHYCTFALTGDVEKVDLFEQLVDATFDTVYVGELAEQEPGTWLALTK